MEEVIHLDRFGEHVLVGDAEEADLILFVDLHQHPGDWRMRALRDHPLVRTFPEKAFVYDERDAPRDELPGVYVAMPRRTFDPRRHRAFGYYRLLNDTRAVRDDRPDLLFSFRGRRVGMVRSDVLAMSHPRAIIEDTSGQDFFGTKQSELADERSRYRELLGRSKFVLCPRGAGASSLRLFETLACGRVPVVLSDEWMPPAGIDWQSCSVRISESQTNAVAERLEALEPDWPAMSAAAGRVYDEWFAPEVWFHRAVELCRDLMETGSTGLSRQWSNPAAWRAGARHWKAAASNRALRARAKTAERPANE
jgi:exostosin family protein